MLSLLLSRVGCEVQRRRLRTIGPTTMSGLTLSAATFTWVNKVWSKKGTGEHSSETSSVRKGVAGAASLPLRPVRGAALVTRAARDHYKVLGVSRAADGKELKRAYRALVRPRRHHWIPMTSAWLARVPCHPLVRTELELLDSTKPY